MSEEQLINLEMKVAHQEVLLEELHQALYAQQKTIDKLEQTVATLTKLLKETIEGTGEIRGHEKPPHY